jgi:hypothetical protein
VWSQVKLSTSSCVQISITRNLFSDVPKPAMVFGEYYMIICPNAKIIGAAGLLPYLGTSSAIVLLAREASLASFGQCSY